MALPPKVLIQSAKFIWTTIWKTMMQSLAPGDRSGAYQRPDSQFRHQIMVPTNAEAQPNYIAQADRYYLYVGYGCPWAHRTLVMLALKGLESVIGVRVAVPSPDQGIWKLETPSESCQTVPELYQLANPGYQGRSTVPILWDSQTKTIVNNESSDILQILNSAFNAFAQYPDRDFYPEALQSTIDEWNDKIYHAVNNGVYRCGFAQTQTAYNQACRELFDMLDTLDAVLATQRYVCGDRLTLTDVRLFTTLFRFDVVYYSLFKCSRQRIADYPNLGPYLRDLYQIPGVAATCHLEAVKQDYYGNLFPLNPGGIIPETPQVTQLDSPHDRDRFFPSLG
jgi:glutathionyl-hydroquinone reductase